MTLFEQWYAAQLGLIGNWLGDRSALHPHQCACMSIIIKVFYLFYQHKENKEIVSNVESYFFQKMYSDFELQGVIDDKLNSKTYNTVSTRMQAEEATCSLIMSQRGDDSQ